MTTTLSDLLRRARDRHDGASGRALAEIAQRAGYELDRTQVNALLNGTYKHTPRRPVLEGIAHLAGVSIEETYRAAGLPVPGPRFADELPDDADLLTARQRTAILGLIREMVFTEQLIQRHIRLGHPAWAQTLDTGSATPGGVGAHRVLEVMDGLGGFPSGRTEDAPGAPLAKVVEFDRSIHDPIAAYYRDTAPTEAELRDQHEAEQEDAAAAEERRRQDESDGGA